MRGKFEQDKRDGLLTQMRKRKNWRRATAFLSLFVVLGTVAALMLPAVTMAQPACGLEEHAHTAECYQPGEKTLTCTTQALGEYLHTHDAMCYDGQGVLVCTLEEQEDHAHTDVCYQLPEATELAEHVHVDTCYSWIRGESLSCTLEESQGHTHTDTCYATGTELICSQEEHQGHTHVGTCTDLICGLTETAGHVHDESCTGRICTLEENEEHAHTDTCYGSLCGQEEVQPHTHTQDCYGYICAQEESQGHTHGASCHAVPGSLLCQLTENEGHIHTEECYELIPGELICTPEIAEATETTAATEPAQPLLICEKPQLQAHTHTDACYAPVETTETGETLPRELICQLPEIIPHQHDESCFTVGEDVLICQLQAHVHTDACQPQETLPPEAQQQVDDVIFLIDVLQPVEQIDAELARLEEAGDTSALTAYKLKIENTVKEAFDSFHALNEVQKEAVTNSDKLAAYQHLYPKDAVIEAAPAENYKLSVTYGTAAALPADVALSARQVTKADAEYTALDAQLRQALYGQVVEDVWLFDINLTSGTGTVQPAAPVTVRLQCSDGAAYRADATYHAVHFGADGVEVLPVTVEHTDGVITGFGFQQSGFSPTGIVSATPTNNPADNGPDKFPVDYYVYIDGAWTLVGSTKTGWYGTKTASDAWSNTNRDYITVDQAKSILGAYGFTGYANDEAIYQLFYQRKNESDYNLHNDTKCYTSPAGELVIPLARNVLDTMGYNIYYSPASTAVNHPSLAAFAVPANSKFYSVSVLDANHVVYGADETLPATQVVKSGGTVSITVKPYEKGWQWTASDGVTPATGTENADGTFTYTTTVTKKMILTPKTDNLDGATASGKKVHFVVWLDGKWTEVGSVDTSYYKEGYCQGSNDSAGNARYRWFITTDQAYSVLAPFGFDPAAIVSDADEIAPSKNGDVKCLYFMHQTGAVNTSGKDVYSSGSWSRLADGKTWAIGMSYSNQEYTMYYVPGSNQYYQGGDGSHTADIFAQTASNLDGSRFWSVSVRDDNQLVYSADVVQSLTSYVLEGNDISYGVYYKDGVLWSSTGQTVEPVQDENEESKRYFHFTNVKTPIQVVATAEDPAFTVQYFGTIVQYVTSGGSGEALKVIDTSGKNLPKNGGTHKLINIYLKNTTMAAPSGSVSNGKLMEVESKEVEQKLYADGTYNFLEYPGMYYVDKLRENDSYIPSRIGVLKPGKSPNSTAEADFDWYHFNAAGDNVEFTNVASSATTTTGAATKDMQNKILIQEGAVLRIMYGANHDDDSYVNKAIFHDYDITSNTTTDSGRLSVGVRQINNRDYYLKTRTEAGDKATNGLEGVYAFGNANCLTGLGNAMWGSNELNKYNNNNSDTNGTTFGLVTGFDSDNNVIWKSAINAPANLFSNTARLGKTTYNGGSLTFNRVGDTYTLTAANSTVQTLTNLEYFFTPKLDTSTRTNNFWVLDKATDKKDPLMGGSELAARGYERVDKKNRLTTMVDGTLPRSDDGKNHNWFFGMNFAVSFTLTEDYIGPLDYLFFGDDDLWVFLTDNKTGKQTLICDIGGVHISVGQYVNLRDYLPVGTSGQYTLNFFYTERGASGSTCWMSFTLPSVTSATTGRDIGGLQISKDVIDYNGNRLNAELLNNEYKFDVALLTEKGGSPLTGTYSFKKSDINSKQTYGSIKHGGTLTLHPGDTVVITGLPAGAWYEITEQEGSRLGYTVSIDGASGYILKGEVESGQVTESLFINRRNVELPATGGGGTIPYICSGMALMAAPAFAYTHKRKRTGKREQ